MARAAQREEQRAAASAVDDFQIYEERGDKYHVPEDIIPSGQSYQWCRAFYMGVEDRRNIAALMRNRWTPVPADREGHEIFGGDDTRPDPVTGRKHPYEGGILLDGLLLMERPAEITEIVRRRDQARAKGQVRSQIERLKLVPEVASKHERQDRQVSFRRDRDLSIPEDMGYDD